MEDLLSTQQQLIGAIEQLYGNFKKDGPERKTGDYIRRRLETLDKYWQEFQNNHFKLCGYGDRSHDYFVTEQFETTKERYEHVRSVIVNYQARDAKPSTSLLRPATPLAGAGPSQTPTRTSSTAARADCANEKETHQVTFRAQGVNSRTDELLRKQASNFRALQRKVTSINLDTELDKWEFDDILKTLQSRWSAIDALHLEIDGKNQEYDAAFYHYEQLYDDMKLKGVLPPRSSPIIYFKLFFSDEVLTHIVEQTNLYALQNKQKNWENTFVTEIRAFLGMLVLMGVHPLPNIDLYWSSDPFFCVSEIADVMTSKRFKMILKNLHLNDNSQMPKKGEPQFDKLYKIRPLIKTMNETFQSAAKNKCSQSIDECMVKFKGRSSLKQFLPNKPVKRGFKIWARCDSQTGYLFEFEIYTGKKGNEAETGLGESVVKDLCQKLIDEKLENVHVTFDNYFSSTELLQKLYENNIYSTSTVRTNRTNLPKKFRRLAKKNQAKQSVLKLAKGQYKWRVIRNVSFFTWMDTKLVTILSTAYHPKSKVTCKRTQKDGSKKEFP
ncbi:unnamed protein product [Euphydryas editha]|uniref:PiggyBac transposable element-derived protein domain-containing protein n=1 Tax=Euphydryas editha TaxID=104508 RepID=A0AAU9TST9_EUPED|nr:unnamed protein product [Euphydryas editha]